MEKLRPGEDMSAAIDALVLERGRILDLLTRQHWTVESEKEALGRVADLDRAIAVLRDRPRWEGLVEAAGKVDRDTALSYLSKWKDCFGSGHQDNESEADMRQCLAVEDALRDLLAAIPEEK